MSLLNWRERTLVWLAVAKGDVCAAACGAWRAWSAVTEFVGRNAKPIILILMLMNLFGILAPDTATALRDIVLAMIF